MKKLLALLLAAMMMLGCVSALADAGSEPDWTEYNKLIADIKATTDFAKRAEMMHQAEDILMDTGAIYVYTQNASLEIRNNYIHDISGPYDNRGIFCDDGTVNTVIEGNTVLRIANSYCIDLRRALSVETRSDSHIRKVNVGNRLGKNRTDGKIRFEQR
jgi:hypothetical protein